LIVLVLTAESALGETAICNQATTLFRQHHWAEAAEAFANCDKAAPGQTDALLYRGKALVNQRVFPAAAASLESYIASHPQSDEALYLLGYVRFPQDQPKESLCLEAKNKVEPAIAAYKKAIELDSASAAHTEQPYLNLGKLLTTLNRAAEALPLLAQAAAIAPDSAPVHYELDYELGRAQFSLEQFEPAREQLEHAVSLDPNNSSAHYLLGRIYKRLGKSELAAQQFKVTEELIRQQNAKSGGMASNR